MSKYASLKDYLSKSRADRIIVATAREYGLEIVTRGRRILDYAEQGHIRAIAC